MIRRHKIAETIRKVSFSETEIGIISCLASSELASISHLSRKINKSRSSIYPAIRSLLTKKVICEIKKSNRKVFCLQPNVYLGDMYLYVAKKIYSQYGRKIIHQIPSQEIKTINALMDTALTLKRGEIIYSIETSEDILYLFEKDRLWNQQWQEKVKRKEIVLKGIGTKEGGNVFQHKVKGQIAEIITKRSGGARILPEISQFPLSLVSFRDYTAFFSRPKKKFFVVKDQMIATTIQELLDLIYIQSSPIKMQQLMPY